MTGKQLGILILICAVVLIGVYYLPVFLGPKVFGQDFSGALSFMLLISKLW
jgi:hypothetical protein